MATTTIVRRLTATPVLLPPRHHVRQRMTMRSTTRILQGVAWAWPSAANTRSARP